MRTVLLILGTVILLAGGYTAYWFMQSADVAGNEAGKGASHRQAKPIADSESTYAVRGGRNVWLKQFDDSRRQKSQFRAEEFNPQKDGTVLVKKPEAHFFLKGGQWIRVTGETGDVVVAGMPESGTDPFAGGASAAPTRGRLQNVHLELYETEDAAIPTLDMEMNNAAFDNESFRIFTEAYTDPSGTQIAADQVKVRVRGKYEFDGRGLTIRWNDRDRRLELLEIAHGDRLVVKEPGALGTKSPMVKPASAGPAALLPADPMLALASADPAAASGVAAAATTQSNASTLYSIWFYDNVQVVQEDKTLATGTAIEVFYAMRDEPRPSTRPATAPADSAPAPKVTAPAETASPSTETPLAPPVATQPAQTQPAAEPEKPITIYWTGKLRIVPSETPAPAPLAPGETAVQMRGAPVVLSRDNMKVRCQAFTYRTTDGGVTLHNSDAFPQVEIFQFANVEQTGIPAVTLLSETVDYSPKDGIATLAGKSSAIFPADEAGKSGETARASWTQKGVARFSGTGNDTLMKGLELAGDVDVSHPQLSLKSQRLQFAFDPPSATKVSTPAANDKAKSAQPVVRGIIADENVHCILHDESGVPRELHGDHLDIATVNDATGKLYPKVVNATGNVIAKDADQELATQELALHLAPAPEKKDDKAKPAKQPADASKPAALLLEKMVARNGVRAVTKQGDIATGDSLVVTMGPDGQPQVGLSGSPAKIQNAKGTVLTSAKIAIPSKDLAQAVGAGTLHAVVEDKDKSAPPRHMDVSWTESALVNGNLKTNQVQLVGAVKATMPDKDGTINTSSAERMLITLVDKPADPAATTQKSTTKKTADAKAEGTLATTDVDVMKGKDIGRILLNKDAIIHSRLAAADGSVLREMRMNSSLIEYDAQTQRLLVPRPGQMLVRDHTPPAEKTADSANTAKTDGLSAQRGATAFRWAESLDYSGTEKQATMKGDVVVAYKPDTESELPVNLRADSVIATFDEAPKDPVTATPPDKAPSASKTPAIQLRSVRAEGQVNVIRGTQELSAPRLTYDPTTHWIRALGNEQVPAVFSTTGKSDSTSAREFQWNTDTWQIRVKDAAGRSTGR